MNPTVSQILVQTHQRELAIEAASVHLAATSNAASRLSRPGTSTGTRRWIASLASSLLTVVR